MISSFDILLLFAVLLIFGTGIFLAFYRKKRIGKMAELKIREEWQSLQDVFISNPEQAVLKADKLLDFALEKAGYTGTLGEKLRKARFVFRDAHAVWSAHKLRNRIAHDLDIRVSSGQAKRVLMSFYSAFRDLGISL